MSLKQPCGMLGDGNYIITENSTCKGPVTAGIEWWGAERGPVAPGGSASLPNLNSALIYPPWGLALFVS